MWQPPTVGCVFNQSLNNLQHVARCLPSDNMQQKMCSAMVPQGAQGYSASWTKPRVTPMRVFVWLSKPGQTNVQQTAKCESTCEWSCCPNKPVLLCGCDWVVFTKKSFDYFLVRWSLIHFIFIESPGCQKAISAFCSARESGHLSVDKSDMQSGSGSKHKDRKANLSPIIFCFSVSDVISDNISHKHSTETAAWIVSLAG